MNEKTLKEKNVIIAEFEGFELTDKFPDKDRTYMLGKRVELDSTFKYNSDYNELMRVWKKLRYVNVDKNNVELDELIDSVENNILYDSIEIAYDSIVKTIQLYNSLKNGI